MDSNVKPPSLVTRKEASILLRSSLKSIDRLIRDGRIRAFKIGSKVLIYEETLCEENINAIKPKFI